MSQNGDSLLQIYIKTLSNIFYPIILGIGVIGNILVILVILKTKEIRTSTNIFLGNLAIADLINLLICCTLALVDINIPGVLGVSEAICKLMPVFAETLTYASVLTVLAIGYQRYYAICQPFKAGYVCTVNRAYKICLLSWPLAVLFSIPYLSIMVYQQGGNYNGTYQKPLCLAHADNIWRKAFIISSASAFFTLPMIILIAIFVIIVWHLKRAAESTSVNIIALRHRRHVVTMLAIVVFCFFVCQLPFRIFSFFMISAAKEAKLWLRKDKYYNWLLLCRALIYFHSAVNPVMYTFMSKRFREGFKSICCAFRCRRSTSTGRESTDTKTTVMNS